MAGATRRSERDIQVALRDPVRRKKPWPYVMPRVINVAWASIATDDLLPGELVYNENDGSLVYREEADIFRYDYDATRTP